MIPSPPRAHASPRRASTSQALKKRRKVAFPGSHERECDLHRLGLARWWALARKHGKLHAEGAARPSDQGRKRALSVVQRWLQAQASSSSFISSLGILQLRSLFGWG